MERKGSTEVMRINTLISFKIGDGEGRRVQEVMKE
jgi:hypothetical protein